MEGFMRVICTQMLDILDSEDAMEQIHRMHCYGIIRQNESQCMSYTSLGCVAVKLRSMLSNDIHFNQYLEEPTFAIELMPQIYSSKWYQQYN
ncbi:hypothetical protein N7447_010608 [Penicillium robsamsonii]|uniref:uncharacterized protein n=1 Tax=Penicillium robsamsonii TaxID=1792511 RepID=UPI00254980A3|nr:uncharacterized protein N7447_010608 [Penicillium robsamsonii]KAJ5811092.1 hypothetical protein N7447_010608 [Penicillium robsamsonii]